MKKLLISALAAVGITAMTLPAFALEHEFGGFWRTRAYSQQDYGPFDNQDLTQVDTRTRLYYTAKFSDNFKFVNQFEFNAVWGDTEYGDIGADGRTDFRVKRSYVDLTFCDWNTKIGIQGDTFARGFLFDDDFSGINLTYNGNGFNVPLVWIKASEGGMDWDLYGFYDDSNDPGDDLFGNDFDVDALLLNPTFNVGQNSTVNPFVMYMRSDDLDRYVGQYRDYYGYWGSTPSDSFAGMPGNVGKADLVYVGLNADINVDALYLWFTGIYSFGTIENDTLGADDYDVNSFLVAAGAEYDFGSFDIHGQGFYATGDDDDTDSDLDTFIAPIGQSYYWSEIMGYKTFDNHASFNSPNERINNIWAVNLGTTFKPSPRWTLEGDVWYAKRAEDVANWEDEMEDELGTEFDLAATYKVFENLDLRFVGAYLLAGDATGEDDPWLVGSQLQFSF